MRFHSMLDRLMSGSCNDSIRELIAFTIVALQMTRVDVPVVAFTISCRFLGRSIAEAF